MLRAITIPEKSQHRAKKVPGSIWFTPIGEGEEGALWFYCPCGCGQLGRLTIGRGYKPLLAGPSWRWNGSLTEPTLTPSVRQSICGWHGWLRDGYWDPVS